MKPTIWLPRLPEEIQNWWWDTAKEKWPDLGEEKLLNLLRAEIVQLSDRFNKVRSFTASSYGGRDLSIIAYGNFYFYKTWTIASFAVTEALSRCKWQAPKKGPIRILDLGSGSGASGMACISCIRRLGIENSVELHALDYSGKSLNYLKDLFRCSNSIHYNAKIIARRCDLRFETNQNVRSKYDIILLGFSLNEINQDQESFQCVEWIQELSDSLKGSGRLVITEPAEVETCRNLQSIMSMVAEQNPNLFLQAPYFNGKSCPMMLDNSKYFSHEVRRCSPLNMVEKINRSLNLEIREVKFGLSILGFEKPCVETSTAGFFRIISPIRKRKGTISFLGVGSDGKEYQYELQRRELNKFEEKKLLFLERGDVLEIAGDWLELSDKQIRIPQNTRINPIYIPRIESS